MTVTPAAGSAAAGAAPRRIVTAALAAATAMHDPLGVRQLVAEAAFQPSAQPRQLRRIQAQVLLLGHLDRDWLEGLQERRAAQRAAAGPVAAVHLRFVAHADLPHLDPRAEFGRQLADQFAEIDAAVGGEVENQLRAIERLFDARELHAEAALANLQERDPVRFLLAKLVLHARDDVLARRDAHHPRRLVAGRRALRLELWNGADDRAERRRPFVLDDDRGAEAGRSPAARRGGPAWAWAAMYVSARPTGVSLTARSRPRACTVITAALPSRRRSSRRRCAAAPGRRAPDRRQQTPAHRDRGGRSTRDAPAPDRHRHWRGRSRRRRWRESPRRAAATPSRAGTTTTARGRQRRRSRFWPADPSRARFAAPDRAPCRRASARVARRRALPRDRRRRRRAPRRGCRSPP